MATEARVDDKVYTIEEFMRLPDDGYSYDLVDGRLERMSPAGGEHGLIASRLNVYLATYAWEHGLGDTFAAETAFVLDAATRNVRGVDLAFVASSRLAAIGEGAIPFPPDLAVEVVSPTDRLAGVRRKVSAYQRAGVPLVWVVNPRRHIVEVYHPDDVHPTTLGLDDELDGENVVPGFTLPVRKLFGIREDSQP